MILWLFLMNFSKFYFVKQVFVPTMAPTIDVKFWLERLN